jgi:hypothetical protein
MEIVKRSWIERGIPEKPAQRAAEATCRRKSTRDTYDAQIRVFSEWHQQRDIRPLQTTLAEVASFLNFLFEEKDLQVSTIMGYRAATAVIHPGWEGIPVRKRPLLTDMIKAFTNERTPSLHICPGWNLPLVLMKLCLPPFEH